MASVGKTMEKTPYNRPPTRLKCVAANQRSRASSYDFGDSVSAKWQTVHNLVLSDNQTLLLLTLKEEENVIIKPGQTYLIRNLGIKDGKAYINAKTSIYRSYDMPISAELTSQALALLSPPSEVVEVKNTKSTTGFISIQGKIISISAPRKIFVKGTPLPITELQLSQGGQEVAVTLWREAALQAMKVGEWISLTHLRASNHKDYGFKLNSSVHTAITNSSPSSVRTHCVVEGVLEEESHFLLVLASGTDVRVPREAWQGTTDDFIKRLPLSVTIDINGDVITSPADLFEDEFGDLGLLDDLGSEL